MRHRQRALVVLGTAVCAAALAAPPALGQEQIEGTATVDPNLAGSPSTLRVTGKGQGTTGGELPRAIALRAARGFRVDTRARARRCSAQQASNFECPKESRIGGGRVTGTASGAAIALCLAFDATTV